MPDNFDLITNETVRHAIAKAVDAIDRTTEVEQEARLSVRRRSVARRVRRPLKD